MEIKQKKQMNLPQLIEWAWSNPKLVEKEYCDEINGTWVYMNVSTEGGIHVEHTIHKDDTFTVEVEEEITEDTELPMIIECEEDLSFWVFKDITLKNLHECRCVKETTKYYRDTDGNMYIIWRDGKLVE